MHAIWHSKRATPFWTCVFVIAFAGPSVAQDVTLTVAQDGSLATRSIQLFALVTILSLVPGIAIMVTCFPFIVTVLAILRQAIGLQQSPPNMLMISLALFLTYFAMEPVFNQSWATGIKPFLDGAIDVESGFRRAIVPLQEFMSSRVDIDTLQELAALRPDVSAELKSQDAPLSILVPSFLLSEIEHAFRIGFIIFLPFLIIDLVVAAILMSMGMMMVPPAIVSLPFKLAFFVVADGWTLIAASLVRGYAQ